MVDKEFSLQRKELQEKAIIEHCLNPEFNNLISFISNLNKLTNLEIEKYDNNHVMSCCVELNCNNKEILKAWIKDTKAYKELIDLCFSSTQSDNTIDLCYILDKLEELGKYQFQFRYKDSKGFYIKH